MKQTTAIIIGAGPAGLTAAYQLLKETDILPIVLEETDAIGGISRTVNYKGNRMDIGGHRFFSKNPVANDLWRRMLPPGDPERQERVMLRRPRASRIFYLRKFFDYPISLKPATIKNMGLARTMKAGFGYFASVVRKRPERSLEDFYINRFGKPLYSMFFEDYTEKLWGVHPSEIAPDWGAQRVKGLSLTKALLEPVRRRLKPGTVAETSLIEEFWYPKRGPGQLWEAMADEIRLMGGVIRMNSKVTDVIMEEGQVAGVVANAEEQRGDYVISSMAVVDLVAAMGGAPPENVREIAAALPYRDFITVGLLLTRLRLPHMLRDNWIYIQERDVKIGRLQIYNNWSPWLVNDPETVWLGLEYFCCEGDALWRMPREDFIRFAIDELSELGFIGREDVLDAAHIRVKKAYPAYFGVYGRFGEVRAWLDGIPNLFCVGRNGQHRYNNMDHSMLTAIEAVAGCAAMEANDAEKLRKARTAIWNVNTEEEYHEQSYEAPDS